jgi:hypothetical protein
MDWADTAAEDGGEAKIDVDTLVRSFPPQVAQRRPGKVLMERIACQGLSRDGGKPSHQGGGSITLPT